MSPDFGPPYPAQRLARTPGLLLGPFYPLRPARRPGTRLSSHEPPGVATLVVSGRVLDESGRPLADVSVEIWHADESGHYRHPRAAPAPSPTGRFTGHGRTRTDGAGRYAFRTRCPGAYGGAERRAPHIHFQASSRLERLVTQMFLPDEALNASDRWLNAVREPTRLVARVISRSAQALELEWDLVLAAGDAHER